MNIIYKENRAPTAPASHRAVALCTSATCLPASICCVSMPTATVRCRKSSSNKKITCWRN